MRWKSRYVYPVLASLAITGSLWLAPSFSGPHRLQAESPAKVEGQQPAIAAANELSKAFRAVHSALKDTVVNIDVSKKVAANAGIRGRAGIPDDLKKMLPPGFDFGEPDGEVSPNAPDRKAFGTGSGVVMSADGYILTNNHVVEDADEINVKFDGGTAYKAKIIGTDPKTDLAVIKIDGKNLKFAALGDSDSMDVGDWVLAFGSPFGFDQTMTQGIISAKGRQINIIGANRPELRGLTYENFLQTDAAINPGNSGGPLVNLTGEVVGINTAIASRSGAYNGIGFAIPSNDVRYIMDSLIKNGKVIRGYMGVSIVDVHEPLVRGELDKLGFKGANGALVKGLQPDSPAGKGGLQLGDVIVKIDGKDVTSMQQLRGTIARTGPDTKVVLTVIRDGKPAEVNFKLGKQPDSALASAENKATVSPAKFDAADLGVSVQEVDGTLAKKYGLNSATGVLITKLDPKGLAAENGLQLGDIITKIDKTDVAGPKEFSDAMAKVKLSNGVSLQVRGIDGSDRLLYVKSN